MFGMMKNIFYIVILRNMGNSKNIETNWIVMLKKLKNWFYDLADLNI